LLVNFVPEISQQRAAVATSRNEHMAREGGLEGQGLWSEWIRGFVYEFREQESGMLQATLIQIKSVKRRQVADGKAWRFGRRWQNSGIFG
jgi:hypothetical protein